jgi:hypothetical protein
MKKFILITICLGLIISCAAQQPTNPTTVTFIVDGNVTEVINGTKEHPCEGNWNFCDQVMNDDYSSYVHPEFKSHFLVHESEVK